MRTIAARVVQGGGFAAAAFVSGATMEPAEADAHCGGHGGSCGDTSVYNGETCEGGGIYSNYIHYYNDCSGTCYNGGQGCCISPQACEDAPCKPGGCGGPCAYAYTELVGPTGQCS